MMKALMKASFLYKMMGLNRSLIINQVFSLSMHNSQFSDALYYNAHGLAFQAGRE
jgi:hypothetical protein